MRFSFRLDVWLRLCKKGPADFEILSTRLRFWKDGPVRTRSRCLFRAGDPPRFARPRRRFRSVFPYSFGRFCCCWMVLFSCNFRLCINAKETSCFFSSRSFTSICFSLLLGSQLGRFYPKKINFSGIGRIWPRSRRDEKGLFHRFSPFVR